MSSQPLWMSENYGVLLPHSEDRMMLSSFVWVQYKNATDRRTDGIAVGNMHLTLCAVTRKNI